MVPNRQQARVQSIHHRSNNTLAPQPLSPVASKCLRCVLPELWNVNVDSIENLISVVKLVEGCLAEVEVCVYGSGF